MTLVQGLAIVGIVAMVAIVLWTLKGVFGLAVRLWDQK